MMDREVVMATLSAEPMLGGAYAIQCVRCRLCHRQMSRERPPTSPSVWGDQSHTYTGDGRRGGSRRLTISFATQQCGKFPPTHHRQVVPYFAQTLVSNATLLHV